MLSKVETRKDMRDFVFFPRRLYAEAEYWAPPIWWEEKKAYTPKKNPILNTSDMVLHVARRGKEIVGRNLIYIDQRFNRFYNTRTGLFGAFEVEHNIETAEVLLSAAEKWLKKQGMDTIRGPIHPVAENWGFLKEGFDSPPVFMSPYNFSYYNEFLPRLGYAKIKDLFAYEADAKKGYVIPERFTRFYTTFFKRHPEFSIRRLNKKNLLDDARSILHISNESYNGNWGYVPVEENVFLDVFKVLKMIVDPDAVWFVEDRGTPVGYALGFPDINLVLREIKGSLFPLGWIKLLRYIKRAPRYRLFGLAVMPEYRNAALDVLLYMKIFSSLKPKNICLEANYILEDNNNIKNALIKLKMDLVKTYRIYQKLL